MNRNTIIVDENDEIIWLWSRTEIDAKNSWYRISALWITNSKWEILLAQRALTKKHAPGARWPAVGWTNEEGETYLSNIIKEAKEELGLKITEKMLTIWPKFKHLWTYNRFTQRFLLTIDKPINEFTIQPEEVIAIRRINPQNLIQEFTTSPQNFVENFQKILTSLWLLI